MSIQTELARIKGAKADLQSWVEENGVTVPDGTLIDGLVELAKTVETGGGGVRVEQGSVTFAESVTGYTFVSEAPNIFIAYVESDDTPQYMQSRFIWAIFQDERRISSGYGIEGAMYVLGYNRGTSKYYVPYHANVTQLGRFSSSDFNSNLGATTYKWYAIYGVSAT